MLIMNFDKILMNKTQIQQKHPLINQTGNSFNLFFHLYLDIRWKQSGITIAGGNSQGDRLDQLSNPIGISLDDYNQQTIYIADCYNHRIMQWTPNETNG